VTPHGVPAGPGPLRLVPRIIVGVCGSSADSILWLRGGFCRIVVGSVVVDQKPAQAEQRSRRTTASAGRIEAS
jgi:hypothetical protein